MSKECKFCKGKSGYILKHSVKYESFFSWENDIEPEFTEQSGESRLYKKAQCRDCERLFDITTEN